ncbi:IclR family transcriptional regulator [Alicycliphilus sp. T452]
MEQQNTNRTLLRGLDLLRAVSSTNAPTVTNLAKLTGLPKSTTSRFLAVLVQEGYLRIDMDQRFCLAPKVLELGFSALQGLGVSEVVAAPLQDIADVCSGAANLGELDGTDVIMIARRTARTQKERFYSMNIHIGTRLPALYTATGRVLLGYDPVALEQALERCEQDRLTSTATVDRAVLTAQVEEGRVSGAVRIRNELAPGFGAVAIAVQINPQRTIALSGSYLLADHDDDIESRVEAMLRAQAPTIASLMSVHGNLPAAKK